MALSDLAVYSEYAYSTMTEVLQQQIELFNTATENCLMLRPAAHQGDFSDTAFFAKIAGGTVRRRNAYGSDAIASKTVEHLVDTSVKVAAGTPEFKFQPSNFKWIQQNPEQAGAAFGMQLAKDTMADMLNTGLGATVAAFAQEREIFLNVTADSDTAKRTPSWNNLNQAAFKFGDKSSEIRCWIMHSTPMGVLYDKNITNDNRLFNYGSLNVVRDPFGRLLVMTDSPELVIAGGTPQYNLLGLRQGAIYLGQNNDFTAAERNITGEENLVKTYQAEWSFQLGIQGFSWDKGTGGKSPTNAALMSSGNWDRYATSHKDLGGVLLRTL
jgi:hypothetical protein